MSLSYQERDVVHCHMTLKNIPTTPESPGFNSAPYPTQTHLVGRCGDTTNTSKCLHLDLLHALTPTVKSAGHMGWKILNLSNSDWAASSC